MNAPRGLSPSSMNSGAPACARTRHREVRSSPDLAGGFGSRSFFRGETLPLQSAQDLRGNVSSHQPTVPCLRQFLSFQRVKTSHEGLIGCGQFLPEIGQ